MALKYPGRCLGLLTRETTRGRSVDEYLEWIGSEGAEKVIIGGDFNTVFYSRAIRKMGAVFEDVLWHSL